MAAIDEQFMKRALQLAYSNLGNVSPNPSVGAVIVKNRKLIGEGVTRSGNHAEVEALRNAGDAQGATLYTTLEPCSHSDKKTPPCIEAIITAKVKKVVIGTIDRNPKVNGQGIEALKKAGIDVITGVMEKEAQKCHEFFFTWITTGKPFVTIKAAMTLDGSVTWGDGVRKKITGNEADRAAHLLRKQYDAILVGVHTVLKDNPELTTRLVEGKSPVKVVLDSQLNMSLDAAVVQEGNTIIFCLKNADKEKKQKLKAVCDVVEANEKYGMVDAEEVLSELGKSGITSLLIEGGAKVISTFLNDKLVNKGVFFIAPFTVKKGKSFFELLKGKVIIRKDLSIYKEGEDLMVEGYL